MGETFRETLIKDILCELMSIKPSESSQTGLSRRTRSWHRAVPGSESGLGRAQLCLNTPPVHTLSTGKYSSEFT